MIERSLLGAILMLGASLTQGGCQRDDGGSVTSETHFLARCSEEAPCGDGLTCACGACTEVCSDEAVCQALGDDATCTARQERPLAQSCIETAARATCEVLCATSGDCGTLGDQFVCDRGLCRQSSTSCPSVSLDADEVALLGDLFLADSGAVTTHLGELFVAGGTLPPGDSLRDYSGDMVTAFGGTDDLFAQYATAIADGGIRVAILDAGGPDALVDCDTATAELCPSLQAAVDGLEQLLATMAVDGTEHVVLFFYPRPDDETLGERFELLSPEYERICGEATLSCSFVALAPHFEENRTELLTGMGLLPTDAGAEVTAGLLYGALQSACLVP